MRKGKYCWCFLMRYLWTVLILIFLTSCGRKLEPTMEDYLEPEKVSKFSISVIEDRVTLQWSYPDREKVKIKGFIIEREKGGEKKSLGLFDRNSESMEDRDVKFGEIYTYSIYALKPKGIFSKPNKVQVHLKRLPEVKDLKATVSASGVLLSWGGEESLTFNVYRINHRGERVKVVSTDEKSFMDEISSSFLESLRDNSVEEVRYLINTSKSEEILYRESAGKDIAVSLKMFIPSKPSEIFGAVGEEGVSISWKEIPEAWKGGYRVYRKTPESKDFTFIGETLIPLYLDREYNLRNIKFPLNYRITSKGPLLESEPAEIKIEVTDG